MSSSTVFHFIHNYHDFKLPSTFQTLSLCLGSLQPYELILSGQNPVKSSSQSFLAARKQVLGQGFASQSLHLTLWFGTKQLEGMSSGRRPLASFDGYRGIHNQGSQPRGSPWFSGGSRSSCSLLISHGFSIVPVSSDSTLLIVRLQPPSQFCELSNILVRKSSSG